MIRPKQFISLTSLLVATFFFLPVAPTDSAEIEPAERLAKQLQPWLDTWNLRQKSFSWSGDVELVLDGKPQSVQFSLARIDDESFVLEMSHPEYAVTVVRGNDLSAMILPKHRRMVVGVGQVDPEDHLRPTDAFQRLVSDGSLVAMGKNLLSNADAVDTAGAILFLSKLQLVKDDEKNRWQLPDQGDFLFDNDSLQVKLGSTRGTFRVSKELPKDVPAKIDSEWVRRRWSDYETISIPRQELEKTLARGLRRAMEVLAPSPKLTNPKQKDRSVDHGQLLWVEGQRVALLWGTPEQIGDAHGKLLREEAQRCIDSVVYGFGAVQSIVNGRWFRHDLEEAYKRLSPFIPERHKRETRALAASLGFDQDLLEVVNVFPELFHCSGFAVFGSATKDGKLYHGRVLDYMTTIGLQDAATTFIVAPEGHHAFANIGYGGFIGSVSGMNTEKVSLGEMGGRGEGQWDGVPMATLMRRALEECSTLEDVKKLWADSPRTCEYYYVFADGKNRTAVGVAATPKSIEFVAPGQAHPQLGEGISDAVVLSAGSRLDALKTRIRESYGKIDTTIGQQLMCRPVAMDSNLHNVLFVPEDSILYVSNADHQSPAADRPYARIDLGKFFEQIQQSKSQKVSTLSGKERPRNTLSSWIGQHWEGMDSLSECSEEENQASRGVLRQLCWSAKKFDVKLERNGDKTFVRFPSPVPSGIATNDQVALEWFPAKSAKEGTGPQLPAVIVVHESGRGMTVGKVIAQGIANQGIHAFMIHLPHYGVRRSEESNQADPALALRQSIADVRRSFDAVAVLPFVDARKISLQGTSLGGFVAATTAGLDDRFHRVIVLLAGGDLMGVVTEGKKDAQGFRKQMESRGLNEKAIRDALHVVEPLNVAHRVNAARTWLYSGKYDDVVPPRNSKLFAEAAKLPEGHHIEMDADHYSGALLLPTVLKDIAKIVTEN